MNLIFFVLFVAILLFLFSPTLRAWLFSRFLVWVQRRVLKQMQRQSEQTRQQRTRQGYYTEGASSEDPRTQGGASTRNPQGKLDMDDIATKKFGKAQSEDYVDFEELPK